MERRLFSTPSSDALAQPPPDGVQTGMDPALSPAGERFELLAIDTLLHVDNEGIERFFIDLNASFKLVTAPDEPARSQSAFLIPRQGPITINVAPPSCLAPALRSRTGPSFPGRSPVSTITPFTHPPEATPGATPYARMFFVHDILLICKYH